MKTSSAKAKGRVLQQWVAAKISDLLNIPVEKDGDIESRPMGQSGSDIILRGEAKELFPYSVECKNQQTWGVLKAIEQCKANTKPNQNWLCIFKKNGLKPVVVMDAEHFFELLKYQEAFDDKRV